MEIPISKCGGEIEEEIVADLCCKLCASSNYKWSETQFEYVRGFVSRKEPIPVPSSIDSQKKFIDYVASLKC